MERKKQLMAIGGLKIMNKYGIDLSKIPNEMPLKDACEKCRCSTGLLSESGPHIKVTCAGCNAYIKFAKKEDIARGKTI